MAAPAAGVGGDAGVVQAAAPDATTQLFITTQIQALQAALEGKLASLEVNLLTQIGKLENRVSSLESAASLAAGALSPSTRNLLSPHSPKRVQYHLLVSFRFPND